jgi:hypothetical protein
LRRADLAPHLDHSPRAASTSRRDPAHRLAGLWTLAWKRLKSDHVGMVSLAIVARSS